MCEMGRGEHVCVLGAGVPGSGMLDHVTGEVGGMDETERLCVSAWESKSFPYVRYINTATLSLIF